MANSPVPPQAGSALRPKYFVFGLILLMLAYVLNHNERFLIDSHDPAWEHYRTFKWWLLPHGLTAACALLLGPMQFSDRLRRRFTKLHRVVGRVYVFGALIGAPLGAYIQYRFDEHLGMSRGFTIATVVDATLLVMTTAIAFMFALRGKIQLHRQWMTRSYAVAIVFLEVRATSGLGGWDENYGALEITIWTCLGLALLFADIVIQWQDIRPARRAAAKAVPVAVLQ
ncbi:MAG TPA: DUF2306 domain-containing protein [Terracidiphilus sp.]|jgi:uncharacterized membrane protein|nr:DUF2306 domain-containing protein [Terracidiphilus sp.]